MSSRIVIPLIGASLPPQPSELDDCSKGIMHRPMHGEELFECMKKIHREAMKEMIVFTPPPIESEEA